MELHDSKTFVARCHEDKEVFYILSGCNDWFLSATAVADTLIYFIDTQKLLIDKFNNSTSS